MRKKYKFYNAIFNFNWENFPRINLQKKHSMKLMCKNKWENGSRNTVKKRLTMKKTIRNGLKRLINFLWNIQTKLSKYNRYANQLFWTINKNV
jgi:hypothetical protein